MKKFTLIFCTALIIAALTGCNSGETISDNSENNSSQISDNSGNSSSSEDTNSSDNSDNIPEKKIPDGEPTFLTAPDGTPIYTSEVSEIYTGSEEWDNKEAITLEQAEQFAQSGEKKFNARCEGYVYGFIPEIALNRVDDSEMFEDRGKGESFEFLGELSDKNSAYKRRQINLTCFKIGDKFGELTVKNAYTLFTNNRNSDDVPYVSGTHIGDGGIEFDGELELEGYVSTAPMNTLYGSGGDITFFPNGESSTKLPWVSPTWDRESNAYYGFTDVNYRGYFGDWQLDLGNMYEVDCDTSGLQPGDSFVKVKIVLDNIKYIPGQLPGGYRVDLKSIDVI